MAWGSHSPTTAACIACASCSADLRRHRGGAGGRKKRLAAFAIDDLTAEEEEELLKYLAFIRSRNRSA
jgi:hypothetical protein